MDEPPEPVRRTPSEALGIGLAALALAVGVAFFLVLFGVVLRLWGFGVMLLVAVGGLLVAAGAVDLLRKWRGPGRPPGPPPE